MKREGDMERIRLHKGDCLEIMDKLIERNVKVDMVLTDPPYGTTVCKWDNVIPFDEMWNRINKLIKPNGVTVLFSCQPFTSNLVMSNIKNFELSRETYRQIKSFDRQQMEQFIRGNFKNCPFYEYGDEYKIVRKQM